MYYCCMKSYFEYQYAHEAFFKAHGVKLVYKKGQYIVNPNEVSPWVFFIESGLVDASVGFSDGSKRIIGYFLPGMSFAQSGVFFADSGGGLEYVVLEEATVYRLPRELFLTQLTKDSVFNAEYLSWLLKTQILLLERIIYLGESTLQLKLIRWLQFMCKYYGLEQTDCTVISVPITQDTIADFLHVTRESVGKELRELIRQGHVSARHKAITVVNPRHLLEKLG